MGKRGHSEEEILRVLREVESGDTVVEICRKHGISQQTFYLWASSTRIAARSARTLQLSSMNGGSLEMTQHLANEESPRTTKLYDRRKEETFQIEVEKIQL